MHPAVVITASTALLTALFAVGERRRSKHRKEEDGAQDSKPSVGSSSAVVCVTASSIPAAASSTLPILQLYSDLCQAFASEKARGFAIDCSQPPESFDRLSAAVRGLLAAYVEAGYSDWQRFANFNDLHYVRNLVEESEDFEMMVVCWKHGQGSRVHNHSKSHCWLSVLYGQVVEDRYELTQDITSADQQAAQPPALPGVLGATCPCPDLVPLGSATASRGMTVYVNDNQCLHAVRCGPGCPGQGAVTLHIYAPPVRRVKLFEPDNNRVIERKPGFFTVRGQKA